MGVRLFRGSGSDLGPVCTFLLDVYPGMGLGVMGRNVFGVSRHRLAIARGAVLLCVPASSEWAFPSFHTLANTSHCHFWGGAGVGIGILKGGCVVIFSTSVSCG